MNGGRTGAGADSGPGPDSRSDSGSDQRSGSDSGSVKRSRVRRTGTVRPKVTAVVGTGVTWPVPRP